MFLDIPFHFVSDVAKLYMKGIRTIQLKQIIAGAKNIISFFIQVPFFFFHTSTFSNSIFEFRIRLFYNLIVVYSQVKSHP